MSDGVIEAWRRNPLSLKIRFLFALCSYWHLCVVQWLGSYCIYMATRKSVIRSCYGNQRGQGGEVHFITAGCVPSRSRQNFRHKSLWTQQQQPVLIGIETGPCVGIKIRLSWRKEGVWVSKWACGKVTWGQGWWCVFPLEQKSVGGGLYIQTPYCVAKFSIKPHICKGCR